MARRQGGVQGEADLPDKAHQGGSQASRPQHQSVHSAPEGGSSRAGLGRTGGSSLRLRMGVTKKPAAPAAAPGQRLEHSAFMVPHHLALQHCLAGAGLFMCSRY